MISASSALAQNIWDLVDVHVADDYGSGRACRLQNDDIETLGYAVAVYVVANVNLARSQGGRPALDGG